MDEITYKSPGYDATSVKSYNNKVCHIKDRAGGTIYFVTFLDHSNKQILNEINH